MSWTRALLLASCSPQLDALDATFAPGGTGGAASDGAAGDASPPGPVARVQCASARSAPPVLQSISAPEPRAQAWFGYAGAVLEDTLAVAAPFTTATSMLGEMYLSSRQGTQFAPAEPLAELYVTAGDGTIRASRLPYFRGQGSDFGAFSVALGADVLVVGIAGADKPSASEPGELAEDSGAVEVFRRGTQGWSLAQPLVAEGVQPCALFGRRVVIEGDLLVVSAPGATLDGSSSCGHTEIAQGAVYLYRDDGQEFQLEHTLWADGAAGSLFGESLDLRGGVLAVGAPFERSSSPGENSRATGAVHVYRAIDPWQKAGSVDNAGARDGAAFGASVAVTDGLLAVGAPLDDRCEGEAPSGLRGRVHVFRRSGAEWRRSECLYASDAEGLDLFGWSLAYAEGHLVVGAPFDTVGQGAAYVFRETDERFACLLGLKAPDRQTFDDVFGTWVGVSRGLIAIGAPGAPVPFGGSTVSGAGTVHVFELPP